MKIFPLIETPFEELAMHFSSAVGYHFLMDTIPTILLTIVGLMKTGFITSIVVRHLILGEYMDRQHKHAHSMLRQLTIQDAMSNHFSLHNYFTYEPPGMRHMERHRSIK